MMVFIEKPVLVVGHSQYVLGGGWTETTITDDGDTRTLWVMVDGSVFMGWFAAERPDRLDGWVLNQKACIDYGVSTTYSRHIYV